MVQDVAAKLAGKPTASAAKKAEEGAKKLAEEKKNAAVAEQKRLAAEAAKAKKENADASRPLQKNPNNLASRGSCSEEKTVLHYEYLGACGYTQSTSFTLAEETNITRIRVWYDTHVGGNALSATLAGPNGYSSVSGKITKGGCQWSWCEANWNLQQALKAGTYTLTADSTSVCSNPSGKTTLILFGCKVSQQR